MTDSDGTNLLSDELHELADGIAPPSASAARDRARRGIARHQRNRRAAAAGAGVVVLVAATVFVAVDRETNDSQRPAGTSTPSVSSAPSTTTTSTPTTGSTTPLTLPGTPITVTVPNVADPATAVYSKNFPWGTGSDQVAFKVPAGEGVNGGPQTFTADSAGTITMLDHSNSRVVRYQNGAATAVALALTSPAVTSAAFDDQGRVIIATLGDLAVFGADGRAEGAWKGMTKNPYGIYQLEVDDNRVYSVEGGTYGYDSGVLSRTLVLRDDGSGYAAVRDAAPQHVAIDIAVGQDSVTLTVAATGATYHLETSGLHNDVRPVRLLPDGSLVFVVTNQQSDSSGDLNQPITYMVGRIDPSGQATYESLTSSLGYTTGGPKFEINDDGVAVMGSTTGGGTTVSYYRFP